MRIYKLYYLIGGRLDRVESYELYKDTHAFQLAQSLAAHLDIEVWESDHLVCRVAMVDGLQPSRYFSEAA